MVAGNHYGTPKPSADGGHKSDTVIPGAHPSSEGKRRRNRSNVEAMAAKHNNLEEEQENQRELSTNGEKNLVFCCLLLMLCSMDLNR